MNGLWAMLLLDLQLCIEVQGGREWMAIRVVVGSPILGIHEPSRWVAFPVDKNG